MPRPASRRLRAPELTVGNERMRLIHALLDGSISQPSIPFGLFERFRIGVQDLQWHALFWQAVA